MIKACKIVFKIYSVYSKYRMLSYVSLRFSWTYFFNMTYKQFHFCWHNNHIKTIPIGTLEKEGKPHPDQFGGIHTNFLCIEVIMIIIIVTYGITLLGCERGFFSLSSKSYLDS